MADRAPPAGKAVLRIDDLQVFYGESHALQGVSLTLERGVHSVVGRNGMGKTTLCNTITGLKRARSGSIRLNGREISSLEPHEIHRLGVGYVPQGRRVWPSLTVDEHLRLAAGSRRDASWTVERVYQTFPRLAERRSNGGSQLSGGEQQMLAISRALLSDPKLLVMDEPTEGLAPVIVDQVERMLVQLGSEGEMAILVIEQNIGVATGVSDQVAIMVNGRSTASWTPGRLPDRDLQQRLLGVGRHGEEEATVSPAEIAQAASSWPTSNRIERVSDRGAAGSAPGRGRFRHVPPGDRSSQPLERPRQPDAGARRRAIRADGGPRGRLRHADLRTDRTDGPRRRHLRHQGPRTALHRRAAEGAEDPRPDGRSLDIRQAGGRRCARVPVAAMHPNGASAVFTSDRGASVTAMAEAFARWTSRERGLGGVISAGGSGGTTLATAGMRALPVGIPKVMVSTVAAGDVGQYVGGADIMMVHSVADFKASTRSPRRCCPTPRTRSPAWCAPADGRELGSASPGGAAGGRHHHVRRHHAGGAGRDTPAGGPLRLPRLPRHRIGGRAMEALGDSGMLTAFLDLTTTEVADMIVGGAFPATADRFGAAIRTGLPYVGSVGALDMVNFGARETVPERFRARTLVVHNPNVTLMRTTRDENRAFGSWIGERLNLMNGPVRFLLPEAASRCSTSRASRSMTRRRTTPCSRRWSGRFARRRSAGSSVCAANINDASFVDAAIAAFEGIAPKLMRSA